MFIWNTTGELINNNASYFVSNLNVLPLVSFHVYSNCVFIHFGACSIFLSIILSLNLNVLKELCMLF